MFNTARPNVPENRKVISARNVDLSFIIKNMIVVIKMYAMYFLSIGYVAFIVIRKKGVSVIIIISENKLPIKFSLIAS